MDHNQFLEAYHLLNTTLINQVMDRTLNSVGSNIFLEFGKAREIVLPNGKKMMQKEWCVWVSWASWRLCQDGSYVVGSGASPEVNIQTDLEKLLGKRILSIGFLSCFLDLEIHFEDGYKLTTFFNYVEEDQWVIFLPNDQHIVLDCSSDKAIESVQDLSKKLPILNKYHKIDFSFASAAVEQVLFGQHELATIVCTEGFVIEIGLSAWRLERLNQYQCGRKDYYFSSLEERFEHFKCKLLDLKRKNILSVSVNSSGMDIKLEFNDGYILEIFTHCQSNPWKISHKGDVCLSAKIDI